MTVAATTNRWEHVGNGVTVDFLYDNRIFASTDLAVYLDGILQVAGYTVSGVGTPGGGNVTFAVPPALAQVVVIVRAVPDTQPLTFINDVAVDAVLFAAGLDRATVQVQQVAAEVARSLRLAPEEAGAPDMTLPALALLAGGVLGFDAITKLPIALQVADINLAIDTLLTGLAAEDFLKYDGANWINRTPVEVRADLGSGVTGDALFLAASAAAARTALALGTAAVEGVAVGGSGDLLRADGDGSQITGISRLYAFRHVAAAAADGGGSTAATWNVRLFGGAAEINEIPGAGSVTTLNYVSQTANFTVGQVVTGAVSLDTAVIVADADAGASGTLSLISRSGPFVNGELLTDPLGGSATASSPSLGFTFTQFYLPAGTYDLMASSPAYAAGTHQARLRDVTNGVTLVIGTSESANLANLGGGRSQVNGRFTLSAGAILELQHWTQSTRATDGLGLASDSGESEVYAEVQLRRVV